MQIIIIIIKKDKTNKATCIAELRPDRTRSQVLLSSAGIQLPVVCAKDLPNQDRPGVLLLVLESPVTGAAESSLPPFRGGRPLEVMETCFTGPHCLCSTHINHNEKQERLKLPLLYSYAFLFFPSHSSSSSSSTSQCVIA